MKKHILPILFILLMIPLDTFSKGVTFVASKSGIVLDSDVYEGGGTDQTEKIQKILDKAVTLGRVHLVMDGAALISGTLRLHSNTTIECLDKSCGFFLADSSNCCMVTNADADAIVIRNRNISLIGGTYNHNSPGQIHHRPYESGDFNPLKVFNHPYFVYSTCVYATEFYGVENLVMRDLTIANQRTYALNICNWEHVTIENVHIDRRVRPDAQNQDGLHFLGPGRYLTMRNVSGNSGDDFIAITPDELDFKSSISDVLIDGVHLEDADQGIRILCCDKGSVDRVVVKNVTGTYRSYGFIVNPWFPGGGGHYGNIIFDTIDLRPVKPNYGYMHPFLFKFGGNIESVTLRNIYHHMPEYPHHLIEVGRPYMMEYKGGDDQPTDIGCMIVDGLHIMEKDCIGEAYIDIRGSHIGLLSLSDVTVVRPGHEGKQGVLVRADTESSIDRLSTSNISADCLEEVY